jgi:hypothetical protein
MTGTIFLLFLIILITKNIFMERRGTDNNGNGSSSNAQKGDLASKGGPAAGLGKADNEHRIAKPFNEDLQTQIAVKSKKSRKKNNNSL